MPMMSFETLCARHGVKLTRRRRAVCRALAAAGGAPDIETILHSAQAIDPAVSRVTVYRTVKILQRAGLVARCGVNERRGRFATVLA